jgi:hypothetical protein
MDSNLLYIGNITAHYFTHIIKDVDFTILEAMVRKLYKVEI